MYVAYQTSLSFVNEMCRKIFVIRVHLCYKINSTSLVMFSFTLVHHLYTCNLFTLSIYNVFTGS
jgi:hypothetical protein